MADPAVVYDALTHPYTIGGALVNFRHGQPRCRAVIVLRMTSVFPGAAPVSATEAVSRRGRGGGCEEIYNILILRGNRFISPALSGGLSAWITGEASDILTVGKI
jgi:hypothetical protein